MNSTRESIWQGFSFRLLSEVTRSRLFALFAEVERDLISEHTREGLARARASGKRLGRPTGALGVSRYFGTTPQFWLNLQKVFELRQAEIAIGREAAKCVTPRRLATTGAVADARS